MPTSPEVTAALIAGAIAFAGSGGCGNLAVSNWVRDKGMGMGHYVSLSGEQQAVPATGNTFPQDEKNLTRWKGWWKVADTEQAVTFWLIGTLGIVVLSVHAYSTVAPWFATVFFLAGFFKLRRRCSAASTTSAASRPTR